MLLSHRSHRLAAGPPSTRHVPSLSARPPLLTRPALNGVQRASASQHARRRESTACAAGMQIREVLEHLIDRKDLSEQQSEGMLNTLMDDFSPEQAAAMLVLLRAKGETPDEIAGMARAMLGKALSVNAAVPVVDIVGTGGDGIGSVNISTGASIVAAAAGAHIAKTGNRSVSSMCGSADVLEALDVSIDLGPKGVEACLQEARVGFMYAPRYHPAMRAMRSVRSALKVRTAFNLLGPLLNPAKAQFGLVGVYSTDISELMAGALMKLGYKKALVVHSSGLDELTPMAPADIVEVTAGSQQLKRYSLDPKDVGIPRCEVSDLAGGDAAQNARILTDVFGGAKGPVADALNLNAGVTLAAAQIAPDPSTGVAMAKEAQEAGKAAGVLQRWVATSKREAAAEAGAQR